MRCIWIFIFVIGQIQDPPLPIQPWTNEIDCTIDAPRPLQYSIQNALEGSEDCLYVEVSTPSLKPNKPMPVMFWMGCFFFCGSMDTFFEPTFINSQNVVFVRCGFRLGPFGFISINNIMAPGNSGLKDLVMALKWVHRNITAFGGDPDNVTIFGNGAGGSIVHYMMLSPMATGLFHKAIIQSASSLNNWSLTKNPSVKVFELAKILEIKRTCEMEVIDELRSLPAKRIMEAYAVFDKRARKSEIVACSFDVPFKPCIENEFEGQLAFLTKSPFAIIKTGNFNKVPLIIGSNNLEASMLQYIKSDFYHNYQEYNDNVRLLVPRSLTAEQNLSKSIGEKLLKFYLSGELSLTKDTRAQFLQFISDYYFLYYVNMTVKMHSQFAPKVPIYYYIINYAGEWQVPRNFNFFNSVGHCSETPFIFDIKIPDMPVFKGSRDSKKTRDRMVKMWTNFAKYGNPTPESNDPLLQITWDPVESKDKLHYLSIGLELTKGRNPFHDRMTFWDDLHEEYKYLRSIIIFNDIGLTT